jgi:hypothetical protein
VELVSGRHEPDRGVNLSKAGGSVSV